MKRINKERTDVFFFDDDIVICNKDIGYRKDKFLDDLELVCYNAKFKSVKKDNTEKTIVYRFNIDDMNINVHISKKYEEYNKEDIALLENMLRVLKIRQLKIAALALGAVVGISALAYKPVKEVLEEREEKLNVYYLDRELNIHSGNSIIDGERVNPYYNHNCVFVDDKTISLEDRIKLYCEDHDIEYLEEDSLKKYELLNNNQLEEAEKIDLQEIRKEKQKIKK